VNSLCFAAQKRAAVTVRSLRKAASSSIVKTSAAAAVAVALSTEILPAATKTAIAVTVKWEQNSAKRKRKN
jgi:hypothetical protein